MAVAAKITSKGQVTIPKKIRDFLSSEIVEFKIEKNDVIVRPVKSVGGSLKRYAKGKQSLQKIRDKVWQEVVNEKNENSSS